MTDELPEKVREAIAAGPQRLYPCPRCKESGSVMGPSFMQTGATVEQDCRTCYGTGKLLELPEAFARRIARLAIEESTRSIREKLENAEEGYARRHKDATDLWEKINFPGGLNAQVVELREKLERAQGALLDEIEQLQSIDHDGEWTSESESWELPNVYYFWASANGYVEEPSHWMYQPSWYAAIEKEKK